MIILSFSNKKRSKGASMKIANNITELIGNAPLVRLNGIPDGSQAEIAAKLESFNPLSSIKDIIIFAD